MTALQATAQTTDQGILEGLYRQMVVIREFEQATLDLYARALVLGIAHVSIGQEAVSVGVCSALRSDDYITTTHRGHGHCLAKGASPRGCSPSSSAGPQATAAARAARCISPTRRGILGANAIVGGTRDRHGGGAQPRRAEPTGRGASSVTARPIRAVPRVNGPPCSACPCCTCARTTGTASHAGRT